MIEKFAKPDRADACGFFDLNRTSKIMNLASHRFPKFATAASNEHMRTSETGR